MVCSLPEVLGRYQTSFAFTKRSSRLFTRLVECSHYCALPTDVALDYCLEELDQPQLGVVRRREEGLESRFLALLYLQRSE